MKIFISTKVSQQVEAIRDGFTKHLFLKLNPPFPPVKLLRFDGCNKGDRVALELNFLFFKQTWISDIVRSESRADLFYFVDEGVELPFFLKSWEHHHRIKAVEGGSVIEDEIYFETPFQWLDYLMYPVLHLQFLYRKPVYRKVFSIRERTVAKS